MNASYEQRLYELARTCSEPNWDKNGAKPLTKDVVNNARMIISTIPDDFPEPNIGVESDGRVGLGWFLSDNRNLAMFVDSDDEVVCEFVDYGQIERKIKLFSSQFISPSLFWDDHLRELALACHCSQEQEKQQ